MPTQRECTLDQSVQRRGSITGRLQLAVDAYISEQHSVGDDVLAFWIEKGKEPTYALLSEFAIDLLHVLATSTPVERLFSTAGEIVLW